MSVLAQIAELAAQLPSEGEVIILRLFGKEALDLVRAAGGPHKTTVYLWANKAPETCERAEVMLSGLRISAHYWREPTPEELAVAKDAARDVGEPCVCATLPN